jgi:hypothetical protein
VPKAGYWYGVLRAVVAADRAERGEPADLTEGEVLAWGDAYFARTGEWPSFKSGPIPESPGETWLTVAGALAIGLRGFAPHGSLPRFFAEHRGRYNQRDQNFSIDQILAWADAWHAQTGRWPETYSGAIPGAGGINWKTLDTALRNKRGGLPGGYSLARLLAESRGARNIKDLPDLSVDQIFAWGSAHHARTGRWPTTRSGRISQAPGESWHTVAYALRHGLRKLPGRLSLNRFFAERLGTISANGPPPLSIAQILDWADAFRARTGRWPKYTSGPVAPGAQDTWRNVENALRCGFRGLPGGSTLARLLDRKRGVRNAKHLRQMTVGEILRWADAYHERHGKWPVRNSGVIPEAPGETWLHVEAALKDGLRGLPGGSSLPRLLKLERGARNRQDTAPFTTQGILAWADAHRARTGKWPRPESGVIPEAPDETWKNVQNALFRGGRGLPGNSSISRLLAEQRGRRNRAQLPDLTVPQILTWANAFHARTGRWPARKSGQILEAPGETWCIVDKALAKGLRGLPGRSTLGSLRSQAPTASAPSRSAPPLQI